MEGRGCGTTSQSHSAIAFSRYRAGLHPVHKSPVLIFFRDLCKGPRQCRQDPERGVRPKEILLMGSGYREISGTIRNERRGERVTAGAFFAQV